MEMRTNDRRVDLRGAVWHKSSRSGPNCDNCVEVADNLPGVVYVRDSKNPNGPVLAFKPMAWSGFVIGTRKRAFSWS
jgi:hypothetical protein